MTDTNRVIHQYNRTEWTLGDLRTIIDDTANWAEETPVHLTGQGEDSRSGTIEVRIDE